jgi:hypothetical protein
MEIISRYVREQKRYSKLEIRNTFSLDEKGTEIFIKNLKSYGIMKTVKNNLEQKELSDLIDEDVEVTDDTVENDEHLYVFTYVGIITIGSRIIKSYPKYLLSYSEPLEEMKQILKVLERYSNSEEQIVNLFNGDGETRSFNVLAVILFLINDYHENGVYNNSEDIVEINGQGEILWDKTINEGFSLICNNQPYYMELYTEKTVDDESDFFKRLHECVLTECSKQLEESQLLSLFEMVPVELSEECLDDFGDKEYILEKLKMELNIQFNTRKQILLKTLYSYIHQERKLFEENLGINMYGTNAFNLVWEKVCSEVFNNKLTTPLEALGLSVQLSEFYDQRTKLIDIIDKPVWIGTNNEGDVETVKGAKDTLTPDLITITKCGNEDWFIIFDAKYYNLQLERNKNLRGNPGVSDIVKQYLYQLAYMDFINKHNISVVKNCFLLPTERNEIVKKGTAKLGILEKLKLQNIQIRLLPAMKVYSYYLARRIMNIEVLEL